MAGTESASEFVQLSADDVSIVLYHDTVQWHHSVGLGVGKPVFNRNICNQARHIGHYEPIVCMH